MAIGTVHSLQIVVSTIDPAILGYGNPANVVKSETLTYFKFVI
jgi:hypothetical protein